MLRIMKIPCGEGACSRFGCETVVNPTHAVLIVPTLCVGMHPGTLRVPKRTQSVHGGIPTQSVGTI
jgi:hypothetical protein